MVTKAIIKELPKNDSNFFLVEVPLMEDNTGNEAIYKALLCTNPSTYNGYNVGDVVYIDFEDDIDEYAVILGKLYTKTSSESSTYSILNDLKVTGRAILPENTKFGNYTVNDFINLYNSTLNAGAVNKKDLEEFVRWINTERETSEGTKNIFANKIRVLNGEEYDALFSEESEEDLEELNTTLFFLTSPSPSEAEIIEGE